jgi:hypothetical protein
LTGTEASFENVIKLGTSGRLQQGTGVWGTDFTGSAIWSEGSPAIMMMGGLNNNVKQWWGGSDGKLYAGGGDVILDESGIRLSGLAGGLWWYYLTTLVGKIYMGFDPGYPERTFLKLQHNRDIQFNAGYQPDNQAGAMGFNVLGSSIGPIDSASMTLYNGKLDVDGGVQATGLIATSSGAHIGGTSDPGTNNLVVEGTIKDGSGIAYLKSNAKAADSDKLDGLDSTDFGRPVFLAAPLTSTAWDGDSFSTTSKTLIDLSTVFGVPSGIKAVLTKIALRDSGSDAISCTFQLSGVSSGTNYSLTAQASPINDRYAYFNGIVPCDANGDIYYVVTASGSGTMDIYLEIWGYWL